MLNETEIIERFGLSLDDARKLADTDGTISGLANFGSDINIESVTNVGSKSYPFFWQDTLVSQLSVNMANGVVSGQPNEKLLIRNSGDNDFRVYVRAGQMWSHAYMNSLLHFLDTRIRRDTVTFILGTKMSDYGFHICPSVLSAIQTCNAKVTTIAAGYCSITETFIWAYGAERKMHRYGALTVGKSDYCKFFKEQEPYFQHCLERLVEIGLINETECRDIIETGREKLILYSDFNKNNVV